MVAAQILGFWRSFLKFEMSHLCKNRSAVDGKFDLVINFSKDESIASKILAFKSNDGIANRTTKRNEINDA